MQKDWMVWLVAVLLFVEGVIWARLMGPFPELREISMATVAAWLAAGGTLATAVIAYKAAKSWKAQVAGGHDVELARKLAVQLCKVELAALKAISYGDGALSQIETYSGSDFDAAIANTWKLAAESWLLDVEQLNALLIEAEAVWPGCDLKCFNKVKSVAGWGYDCCQQYYLIARPNKPPTWDGVTPEGYVSHNRRRQRELRVDNIKSPSKDDIAPMVEDAKRLIRSKMV